MYIEIRQLGKKKKYYLSHTYRDKGKVKKVIRYLGSNLTNKQIEKLRIRAEELILEKIKEKNILEFELSKKQIEEYKAYEKDIKIDHLQKIDWLKFAEIFTYNTNAIEGSTVELSEVKELIEHKDKPENSDEFETLNVAEAIDFIRKTKDKLTIDLIKKIHKICFKGTKHFAGKIRDVEVVIRNSLGEIIHRGAPSKEVKELLEELCDWYQKHKSKYPPLLLAALVHNQFERIHPFQDGNGRVGRILLNYVLLMHKYPPINIRLKDRFRYYKCLQVFDKIRDIKLTLKFLISEYKKQYR